MNQERIFELAKQADLIQWDSLPSGARTPDHESVVKARKFAELIVRECAGVAEGLSKLYPEKVGFDVGYTMGTARAAKEIKERFGVEE